MLSFIQVTVWPINLVLVTLICRSYIKTSKSNLYLAFAFGLFISHLNLTPLGFESLVYVSALAITQLLSKARLAGNALMIIPITFLLMIFSHALDGLVLKESLQLFPRVLIESSLSLPILYLIRLWEERFIIRKDIKLKL